MGRRHGLDPRLLWLWHRLAAAAPMQPLALELLYAADAALIRKIIKNKIRLFEKWGKKSVCKEIFVLWFPYHISEPEIMQKTFLLEKIM